MANEKLFYIGIKGLIEDKEGRILLLKADVSNHRKNTEVYWDIPGGRIAKDQTVIDTLKREIEEEIGITKLENYEFLTAVVSNHEVPLGDALIGLILMVYRVKIPENSPIKLSPEHTAYEWVSQAEAKKRLAHKYPKEFTDQL
jgi:8-oxo-dGTP pyrophosphatase MutT (NUDIX family)